MATDPRPFARRRAAMPGHGDDACGENNHGVSHAFAGEEQ